MFSSLRSFMNRQMRAIFKDCPDALEKKMPTELLADHYSNMVKQRRETLLSSETMVGGWPEALFPPIFHRRGMLFLPALRYAQRIFNTGGVPNEPDSHRQLHRA